ncbi:MAG: hydantoinase/oxoprolinase family protein [Halanaerobiales bacterium]|nr:hydantoinase/oxoprolinase family protein [Halanaerobiales bacterium]
MIIGIDVGGTHTDGVIVKNGQVCFTSKVQTNMNNISKSILQALDMLLLEKNSTKIKRIIFSTTLTTNLIAQGKYPPVGLILIPGPGLNPNHLKISNGHNWILSGSVDHRGRVVENLKLAELEKLVQEIADLKLKNLAIVGKFSTRNPALEEKIEKIILKRLPEVDNIQLGNQVAPILNFPRRVQTTWLNTAVYRKYADFLHGVEKAVLERGIKAQLYLLKADGGTMHLRDGLNHGVETIKSGPAASTMGFLALAQEEKRTALILDVGGTTTDIAFTIQGVPLFESKGVQIEDYLTSVQGLLNRSIPFGGDSRIVVDLAGEVRLTSGRTGPAAAFGGEHPTLTDALVVLGLLKDGDSSKASQALISLTNIPYTKPSDHYLDKIAEKIVSQFNQKVSEAVNKLIDELNNKPVYTINELLSNNLIKPEVLMMIGGPAYALLAGLSAQLGLIPVKLPYHQVANALGAAVARPTLEQTLYADTAQKFYRLSTTKGKHAIQERFTLDDARQILLNHTLKFIDPSKSLKSKENLIEITHEECFNIVRNFTTQGQIFRLKAQIKPGVNSDFSNIIGRRDFSNEH